MKSSILTVFSMDHHHHHLQHQHQHPSTLLSMDSSGSSHEELDLEMNNPNRQITLYNPPDINLTPRGGGRRSYFDETIETTTFVLPSKTTKKCLKRGDSMWGAWFFFNLYFKPALKSKPKSKTDFSKSDLNLDVFLVQHDMENLYMWAFKEKPENALGKMQLRSYMNGHSRQGERPFPFSAEKGFVRSHRMQRKHYRGLSNPQCLHGIEFFPSPNLLSISEEDRKRWMELTGRDLKFVIPNDASDFGSWRSNLPNNTDFLELEKPKIGLKKMILHSDSSDCSNGKKRKEFLLSSSEEEECCLIESKNPPKNPPGWIHEFTGVMKNVNGPVTAAKTVYEDEEGYLIVITLPFVDLNSVKVSWRNSITNGIVKITGSSTSRVAVLKRRDRSFKLVVDGGDGGSGGGSEHCPPGEFMREIQLPNRIPEEAVIEAYFDGTGPVLEILVPKLRGGVEEEHEVRVCLRPVRLC